MAFQHLNTKLRRFWLIKGHKNNDIVPHTARHDDTDSEVCMEILHTSMAAQAMLTGQMAPSFMWEKQSFLFPSRLSSFSNSQFSIPLQSSSSFLEPGT